MEKKKCREEGKIRHRYIARKDEPEYGKLNIHCLDCCHNRKSRMHYQED